MATFYRVFHDRPTALGAMAVVPHNSLPRPIHSVLELYSADEARAVLAEMYPAGLSHHGEQYLFNPYQYKWDESGVSYTPHQALLELAYELVRCWKFSHRPSRFTSFFGCLTHADAEFFRGRYRDGQGEIYQVECEQYFQADMNLLYLGASMPGTLLLAERYWSGAAGPNPYWEILLQGPVKILDVGVEETSLNTAAN